MGKESLFQSSKSSQAEHFQFKSCLIWWRSKQISNNWKPLPPVLTRRSLYLSCILYLCATFQIFFVFLLLPLYTLLNKPLIEFQYNISICMVVIYFLYRFVILKYLTIKYAPDKVHNYKTLIQNKWQQLAAIGGIIHFFSTSVPMG